MRILRPDTGTVNSQTPAAAKVAGSREQRAWSQAQNFEQVFLNTMFGQMFTGLGEDTPLGGKQSEAWRGMLIDEYAKSVAAQGGVGIAGSVYRELVGNQGVSPREAAGRYGSAAGSSAAAAALASPQ